MAERSQWWTERCLISLFLSLSLFFSLFLYLSLIIYLPTYWSICLSIYLSIYRSIDLSISLSRYLSVCLTVDRSIDLSLCLSLSLARYLSVCLSVYLSVCLSHLSIYLSIYLSLSLYLSIYLSARSKTRKFCETSFMFEHNNVQNETILRDVLIFWTWQHPKRSNSARLPHFSKFKTSKTKGFCETSFKNGKLSAKLPASYQCVLRFFQSTCLKYCACHGKLMPGHTTCRTCHAKSS